MSISSVAPRTVNVTSEEPVRPAQSTSSPSITQASQSTPPAPTSPTKPLKQLLADQQNLFTLVSQLRNMDTQNAGKPLAPAQIASALKSQIDVPYVGSTYALTRSTPPTLATVIADLGLDLPDSAEQVTAMAKKIEQNASMPPLGNLGGARAWPLPMSQEDQQSIRSFLRSNTGSLPGLPLPTYGNGTLDYLLHGSSVTPSDLQTPSLALQKLLDSPRAQALGQALQTHLKGVPTATSIYDYLLTAINNGLDSESVWSPERNKVGDIYLDDPMHWGEPASRVVEHLSFHLIKEGLASHASAKLATHILLASTSPQFLVKDIPPSVTVGSVLWVQLTIAAAKIEAQTPGRVSNMTYAEVITTAESLPTGTVDVQSAQREALRDWGEANGLLAPLQTRWNLVNYKLIPSIPEHAASEIEGVRTAYNAQLQALTKISASLYTPITTRKELALNCLKTEFPELDPAVFEAKVLAKLYTGEGRAPTGDPRPRSMLDITMEGEKLDGNFKWITNDNRVPIDAFNDFARSERLHAPSVFKAKFEAAIKAQKEGHHGMVKHQISQLPLADRQNFEFGKLEYFYSNDYKKTADNKLEQVKRGHTLIVKTTRHVGTPPKAESNLYEIDTTKAAISKQNERIATLFDHREKTNEQSETIISMTRSYHPFSNSPAPDSAEKPGNAATPNSYDSDRTNSITNFYVQSLGLDDEALLKYASGVTSFDHDSSADTVIGEFLLNLIPFRSAIVNLGKGNYGEAVKDLSLDIFGLLTFGAGKAVQATKALGTGVKVLPTGAKAANAVKFLGVAAIEALNPLNGLGDLLRGTTRLAGKGLTHSGEWIGKLRGASGSYEPIKEASKSYGVVATGTFKIAENTVEGGAVLHNAKWYAFDPVRQQPYGAALADFKPATVAANGEINSNFLNWAVSVVAPNPSTPNLPKVFRDTLEATKSNHLDRYNLGHVSGTVETIPGYYTSMKISDLKELAVAASRTPEEIGTLARVIETRQAYDSIEGARIFSEEIAKAGGKATGMPQNLYLAQNDLASAGECAALANTMALAIQHGRKDVLIANFFKASTNSTDPAYAAFRKQLNSMHQVLSVNFHGIQPVVQVPYKEIISRLGDATASTTLKISTQNHGLLAGVTIKNGQKEWFFFDPNFGLATFPDKASMARGLEVTLNSGRSAGTLDPVAITRGVPEYTISTFSDGDFLMTVPYNNPFALFNAPI